MTNRFLITAIAALLMLSAETTNGQVMKGSTADMMSQATKGKSDAELGLDFYQSIVSALAQGEPLGMPAYHVLYAISDEKIVKFLEEEAKKLSDYLANDGKGAKPALRAYPFHSAAQKPAMLTNFNHSELAVLSVTAENVRVRTAPCTVEPSKTVGRLDNGGIIVVEKATFNEEAMSWYRIIGMVNKETGVVTDVKSYRYVSADFVEPYSGAHAPNDLFKQISTMPYGVGYGVIDHSPQAQLKMAEQKAVRWCFSPGDITAVYTQPSATSQIKGYLKDENFWSPDDLITVDTRPGWLFVMDLSTFGKSGWIEEGKIKVAEFYEYDCRETAYLFILNIGANVQEMISRWGGEVTERTVSTYSVDFDDEPYPFVSIKTLITGNGFKLNYEDHRNLGVELTRKGAGIGGIFIGETWCNKAYIEKTFKHLGIEIKKSGDEEYCVMHGGPDGWKFSILVDFDKQGSVSKLSFSCEDVMLN